MQEGAAASVSRMPVIVFESLLTADESVPAAGRDPAEFLDSDVNQQARPGLLITDRSEPSDSRPAA